ncbi:MAG TPA: hypothetical protein VE621_03270 [Bryobacteraceae bacterium]|nr:hypothetical protein [Bryobacteraceae bacterium]
MGGIKAVYVKKFTRPIVETSGGVKNPTAYTAKALRFEEIELTSLQFLSLFLESFFGALAVLDVDTRAVPLDNLSVLVTLGGFVVQHPAIFTISPPHARLVQKRLAG